VLVNKDYHKCILQRGQAINSNKQYAPLDQSILRSLVSAILFRIYTLVRVQMTEIPTKLY